MLRLYETMVNYFITLAMHFLYEFLVLFEAFVLLSRTKIRLCSFALLCGRVEIKLKKWRQQQFLLRIVLYIIGINIY
jgi:hypothetical protein